MFELPCLIWSRETLVCSFPFIVRGHHLWHAAESLVAVPSGQICTHTSYRHRPLFTFLPYSAFYTFPFSGLHSRVWLTPSQDFMASDQGSCQTWNAFLSFLPFTCWQEVLELSKTPFLRVATCWIPFGHLGPFCPGEMPYSEIGLLIPCLTRRQTPSINMDPH